MDVQKDDKNSRMTATEDLKLKLLDSEFFNQIPENLQNLTIKIRMLDESKFIDYDDLEKTLVKDLENDLQYDWCFPQQ